MAKYERKPSVDDICRTILGRGAVEVRAWADAHPDAAHLVTSHSRLFYEAGAPECWVLFSDDTNDEIEAMVVRLPGDHRGRTRCLSALSEHIYRESDIRGLEDFIDEPARYMGDEYCWVRFFD